MKRESLSKSIVYMLLLQGSNFLVPIILIPLLLSRIGLDNYGLVSLAQSIMFVFVTIGEFGFNITGTRLVSQNLENRDFLKKLSGQTLIIRSFVQLGAFIVLSIVVFTIPGWRLHAFLILSSYLIVIGQAHLPVWFFQGIQQMGWLMWLNVASRIIYIFLVLVVIEKPEDYLFVNILNGGAMILVSVYAWYKIWRKAGIDLDFNWSELLKVAASNGSILLSNIIGDTYRSIAMIIAGFQLSSTSLGLYSVFDKVIQLIQNGFASISRALFPRISTLVASDMSGIKMIFRKYYLVFSLPVIASSLILLFYGGDLMALISKDISSSDVTPYLLGLAMVPILFYIGVPPSISLIAIDLKVPFLLFNLFSLVIHTGACLLLIPEFGIQGILFSFFCSQIFPILYAFFELKRRGIHLI